MDPALNPYRAPAAELDPKPAPTAGGPLASRAQRFWGVVLDGMLGFLAHATIYVGVSHAHVKSMGGNTLALYTRSGTWGAIAGTAVLALNILQWYLITRRGQTIGKMLAGSKIVRLDGRPAGFLRGVILRWWLYWLPSQLLPLLGVSTESAIFVAINVLFGMGLLLIFRADRRCLHDHIAGTKVIDVRPAPQATAPV